MLNKLFIPAEPKIPPITELSLEDFKSPVNAEFVAKTLIYTDNPVKSYYYYPDSSTLIDAGSALGHTFIKVEDKSGKLVDLFEHIPGKIRDGSHKITSQPIPSRFSEVDIKVTNFGTRQIEFIPNRIFQNKYLNTIKNYIPAEFVISTHDVSPSRPLNTLVLEAVSHNTIVAFKEPLTREQLTSLRQTRDSLKLIGYNVRSANCSSYPRALLNSFLTPTGQKKMNTENMGPLLLNDISAHESVIKVQNTFLDEKGEPLYQHYSFNYKDKQKLQSFLDNKYYDKFTSISSNLSNVYCR